MVGGTKSLKVSGIPILGVKSGKKSQEHQLD